MNKIIQIQIFSRKHICFFISLVSSVLFLPTNSYAAYSVTPSTSTIQQIIKQNKITLNIKNKPLKFILNEINKKSGAGISFKDDGEISAIGNLSINVTDATIEQTLDKLLSNTDFTYKIIKDTITIIKREESKTRQTINTTGKQKFSGSVLDATKKPIAGATVFVKDSGDGAITDAKGLFSILAKPGSTLEASFMGKKSCFIENITNPDKQLIFALEDDLLDMEDVVVTGIFNKAKESYTGSVTSISAKDLKNFRGQNVVSTLKNIDPSLNLVVSNEFGSDPNRLPEINIRGNSSLPLTVKELNEGAKAQLNTPLIIMDGFEINLQKLIDFNDEEIESINIMKDASATAIYGSRGANGVIVVVTKAPQAGKIKIYFKGSANIEIPDLNSYDVLNAKEKLQLEWDADLYKSASAANDLPLKERYNKFLEQVNIGANTDWLRQPIQTGVGQKYNIRLEGGSEEFRWGTSASYYDMRGVMKSSSKKTFTGTITLSYQLKNVIFRNQASVTTNNGINSKYGTFDQYVKQNPYQRIHDENGAIVKMFELANGSQTGNPLYNASLNTLDSNHYIEILNNFSIDWKIYQDLRVVAKFGLSKNLSNTDNFRPASHTDFDKFEGSDYFRKGSYTYNDGDAFNYDANITISYSKTINDKHQIYAGVDFSALQRKNTYYKFVLDGYNNDNYDFLPNANFYSTKKPDGSESLTRSVGLTANMNYTYDNKYFVDLSYRIDGSSQFGTENKFAPFYSAGIGWNLHNEKFLSNTRDIINNLRIRGSYGETGSQAFSSYQALSTYQYYVGDRYLMWNGAQPMGIGNENLKWQVTKQFNGGIDVGLWNNRLTASLDLYHKKTSNLLSQMDLPSFHGFDSYTENVGSVVNSGYEASLSGYILRDTKRELIWSVTGKLTYNNNKINKLSDAIKKQSEQYRLTGTSNSNLLFEGDPQNSIYAVRSMGIDPSNGRELFIDRFDNLTYDWDSRDRIFYGESQPKYRGNVSTMFSYKNFTLNLSFGYHWGGMQYNNTLINRIENADLKFNVDRRVYSDTWQKPGDVVMFKSFKHNIYNSSSLKTKHSSRFIQADKMFQLQSANLTYRLNNKWLKDNLGVSSLDLGCSTSDLFTISSIKMERGIFYPFARRVEFSLSLLF